MRYALPLLFAAGPAFAHHEVLTVSILPGMMVWLVAIGALGLAAWKRRGR